MQSRRTASLTRQGGLVVALLHIIALTEGAPAAVVDKTTGRWAVSPPAASKQAPTNAANVAPPAQAAPNKKPPAVAKPAATSAAVKPSTNDGKVVNSAVNDAKLTKVDASNNSTVANAPKTSAAPAADKKTTSGTEQKLAVVKSFSAANATQTASSAAQGNATTIKKAPVHQSTATTSGTGKVMPAQANSKQDVKTFKTALKKLSTATNTKSKTAAQKAPGSNLKAATHKQAIQDMAVAMQTSELIAQDAELSAKALDKAVNDVQTGTVTDNDFKELTAMMAHTKKGDKVEAAEEDFEKLYGEVGGEAGKALNYIKGMEDTDPASTARKAVMWKVANDLVKEQKIAQGLDKEAHKDMERVLNGMTQTNLAKAAEVLKSHKSQPEWMLNAEAKLVHVSKDLHKISSGENAAVGDVYRVTGIQPRGESEKEVIELGPDSIRATVKARTPAAKVADAADVHKTSGATKVTTAASKPNSAAKVVDAAEVHRSSRANKVTTAASKPKSTAPEKQMPRAPVKGKTQKPQSH